MVQSIIDRRLAGKNKSIGNRERFLRRYKDKIREAVRRAVDGRGIRDMERGEDIHIPRKDISEPVFHHGQGGVREIVHPGNREYVRGDRIERPKGGDGRGGGSQASDSGEGEDDFVFHLSKEEFMQVFFEDLALPHLVRTQLADVPEWKSQRAGFTSDGTPNNLHVLRSMRGAIGRRIAIVSGSRRELRELQARLAELQRFPEGHEHEITELEREIQALRQRVARVPYLDPIDLRFRNRIRVPVPTSKAVMFCLMDVSGSMDEARKDLAKRFFILLYLFLTRHYERIDIVFIRHHTQAQEVDEQNFFHVYREASAGTDLGVRFVRPWGGEHYVGGSVQFIDWISEVPGLAARVAIDLSRTGPGGPWTEIVSDVPDGGRPGHLCHTHHPAHPLHRRLRRVALPHRPHLRLSGRRPAGFPPEGNPGTRQHTDPAGFCHGFCFQAYRAAPGRRHQPGIRLGVLPQELRFFSGIYRGPEYPLGADCSPPQDLPPGS